MRWSDRLARLSNPHSERSETPPRDDFSSSPPAPIAPKGSLAFNNGAIGPFGNGVEREKILGAPADDEVENLAAALLAEAERCPAQTIADHGKALVYFRGEAIRRLDLIRQSAADATTGPDPEREAIEAEEIMPMAALEAHKRGVAGLMLAALPLAGVPGALACRGCGRGIWCSPSWKGPPPPDLCFDCWREETI